MGVSLKLMSFTFWAFSLTFAQGQECFREDLVLENTEPLQKASYSHGESVKVTCVIGYTGMHKYTCNKGTWDKNVERECEKKKCGHPEDAPNSDFKLLDGHNEFVFGARVEYTCKKGYEMTSRVRQRTCRSNGWDGAVPVCEKVICPPVPTEDDVTASGNIEEGRYGDVIQFDCVSSDKMIKGKKEIHCKEYGEWSGSVPECIDIMCTPPHIQHLTGELKNMYRKDETLHYSCETGYKPRQGTPKCTKYGWSLQPECEEKTCELRETRGGISKIEPEGKTYFKVGDWVKITCSKGFWIPFEYSNSFQCQPNGQWNKMPVCEEITCEAPQGEHFPDPSGWKRWKFGDKVRYGCLRGYRPAQNEVTCTEDGWTPKPQCAEIVCEAPNIANAQIVTPKHPATQYKMSSKISYKCLPGFKPQQQIEIMCNQEGTWIDTQTRRGIQTCTEKEGSCKTPTLENGYIKRIEENIFYSCNTDYKPYSIFWWETGTCKNGNWSNEPRCIKEDQCGVLPSVPHGQLKETSAGKSAQLKCDEGYQPSQTLIICISGEWETTSCEKHNQSCDSPPAVKNAVILSKPQEVYSSGSHVIYECREHSEVMEKKKVFCNDAVWETPPKCEVFCPKPLQIINNGKLIDETQDERKYSHGDTVRYECDDDYESQVEPIALCNVHTWIYPECVKIISEKTQCTKPTKNLRFVTLSDDKKMIFNNFDILTYTCKAPYDVNPGGTLMCKNEKWNGTFDCTSRTCPMPPSVEDGFMDIKHINADGVITSVSYTCPKLFVLSKQQAVYICQDGKWETPPKCLKPCKITPLIYKDYNIKPVPDNYVRHNENDFRLYCNPGWNVGGVIRSSYSNAWCTDGTLQIERKCSEQNWRGK